MVDGSCYILRRKINMFRDAVESFDPGDAVAFDICHGIIKNSNIQSQLTCTVCLQISCT